MRRTGSLVVLSLLLGALGYLGWARFGSGLKLGAPPRALESRWRTEEAWLVHSITRDLAGMAAFAGSGAAPAPHAVQVTITEAAEPARHARVAFPAGGTVERDLALRTSPWSPDEYVDLGRDLLRGQRGCVAPPHDLAAPGASLLRTLTEPLPATIEQANQAVSAELARRFCSPALHESSALLLSAFALREAALAYSDTRAVLGRVTAHLAFAAGLRNGSAPGRDGRFALASLALLAGRGRDAAELIERLDAEADASPEAVSWRRALRLRLTDDPRPVTRPRSLLERRELYRARLTSLESAQAVDFLKELGGEPITDWWRIASDAGFSVETGNFFLADALEQELGEIREVANAYGLGLGSEPDAVKALNTPAEGCLTPEGPRVIDWGTWASFLQRHLINLLWMRDLHQRHKLGLPQQANAALKAAGARFGGLVMYPLLEVRCTLESRQRPSRLNELIGLVAARPELFTAFEWWAMADVSRYEVVRQGMPNPGPWFRPGLPRGTTYDSKARQAAHLVPSGLDELRTLHALSPLDFTVTAALVKAELKADPAADIEALFGERAEYDLRALDTMANLPSADPVARSRILHRQCDLHADHCYALGDLLVEGGRFAEAAAAYQRGVDLGSDTVAASTNAQWLMNYYLDANQTARAGALARKAAAVGSYGGLETLSRFLERTGDYEGAESLLQRARDRYGNVPQNLEERQESLDGRQDEDHLMAFYYRMSFVHGRPEYEKRFHELADDDFPKGLEKLDLRAMQGRPTSGVFILRTFPDGERRGLRAGDIIVGLDGVRVHSRRQYNLVRIFDDAADMSLVVFRHPAYLELKFRVPCRCLGFEMRSLEPRGAAAG